MSSDILNLFNYSAEEVLYNCRIKGRKLSDGSFEPYEIIYCNRFIFNPDGCKRSDYSKRMQKRDDYIQAWTEILSGSDCSHVELTPDPAANLARSKRRARNKLFDYIQCNDFDCFVTLTLDGQKIDRQDYNAVIKKLNTFLDNRVRRDGLRYVGVPEFHKKGGIHFHLLCNSAALRLVDSGCVSCKGHKKPIKVATADRYGIPLDERHTVYNVADWSLGFSTAVMTYGERSAVANYVGKYITKGSEKIGGRWYYSGGKLEQPFCKYQRVSFNDVNAFTYDFECDGGAFKVVKL